MCNLKKIRVRSIKMSACSEKLLRTCILLVLVMVPLHFIHSMTLAEKNAGEITVSQAEKNLSGVVRSGANACMGTTLTIRDGKAATGYVCFELDEPAAADVQVSFSVDEAALSAYNQANGTRYTLYSGVTLANGGKAVIPAGKRTSDYIAVRVPAGGSGDAIAIAATASSGETLVADNKSFVYRVASLTAPRYEKEIKNLCYIEVNNENPLNAGEYTLSDGKPFFDIVSVFAANINLNAEGMPYVHCNEQVTFVLKHADDIPRPLQQNGIKVHLSILGNHDDAGMRSLSEEGAKAFAKELKMYADIYGFDGFDFDDEYSSYAENNFKGSAQSGRGVVASVAECTSANYTKLMEACRKELPKGESTFGIYWYTDDDQPVGSNVEALIDYTVYGAYGKFDEYRQQELSNAIEAPYAITLSGLDNKGDMIPVAVNEEYLNDVKEGGYGYFAFYDLKSSRVYTKEFNQVAHVLWNGLTVEWTGYVYARTDMTPVKFSAPSDK